MLLRFTGSTRACWLALGALLHLLVVEGRAHADPPSVEEGPWSDDELTRHLTLEWDAPASCPEASTVRDRVRSMLRAKGEPKRQLRARARVTKIEAGYGLALTVDDGPSRALSSETCLGLVEAAALILAVDIEGALDEAAPPSSPPSRPKRVKRLVPKSDMPSKGRHVWAGASARVVADVGSLPRPTSSYRGTLLLGYDRWRLELDITAFARRDAEGPREGTGAHVDLVTGGLRLCRSWLASRRIALGACLGGEAGRSAVAGFGITRPSSSAGLWTAAIVAPELRIHWNRSLPLVLGFEVGAALTRSQAVVGNIGTIFDPDPWLLRGTVGLEFDFFRGRG